MNDQTDHPIICPKCFAVTALRFVKVGDDGLEEIDYLCWACSEVN